MAGPLVRRFGLPPLALMSRYPSVLPGSRKSNLLTIRRPARADCYQFATKLIACALEPSLLHIQISSLPVRFESKTILFPSGENCACPSKRVEEINFIGELIFPLGPATRPQMSVAEFAGINQTFRGRLPPQSHLLQ